MPIPEQVFNLSKSSWKAWGAEEQPGTCPSTCAVTQVWCLCCTYPRAQPGCTGPTQHQLGSKAVSVKLPFSALFHPKTQGRSLWGCQRCCEVQTHPGNNHGYGGQGIPGEQGLSVPPQAPTSSSQPTATPSSPSPTETPGMLKALGGG